MQAAALKPAETPAQLPAMDANWWRGAVIYQIYPRSYRDSNGDGIGDLKGITQSLDHVASLNVDAIWISPFFTSPMDDFGYDVSNYEDVDPMFGTLADFDELIAECHKRGLRVIIDLVISHTSDRHPWFIESRASKDNPKADWYVWADAKPDGTPPTNWLSIFGGSSWEWDTRRCQYYLHNFLVSQPDLNFHTPAVQDAVLAAARFWLERGVDGFRLDTVNFYFHDQELRNNPPLPAGTTTATVPKSNPYGFQVHLYDKNRPENLAFLERLRALLAQFPGSTTVGELGTDENVYQMMADYTKDGERLHMAYSFELLTKRHEASHVRHAVGSMDAGLKSGWASWALSNHDVPRVVSRWGGADDPDRFGPLAVALVSSLRGSPCLYQGEELGLTEAEIPFELLQDPYGKRFWPEYKGRDGCRTPMPWTDAEGGAGFTTGKPWLPVPGEHRARAVAAQQTDPRSVLNQVRQFLSWRRDQPALIAGTMTFLDAPEPIVAFIRLDGAQKILCVFNMGADPVVFSTEGLGPLAALNGHGFESEMSSAGLKLPARGAAFLKM